MDAVEPAKSLRLGAGPRKRGRAGRRRVLDHVATLPSGRAFYNPLRVLPDGDACEVAFTLWREPEITDAEFERDAAAVAADLARLKAFVEARRRGGARPPVSPSLT